MEKLIKIISIISLSLILFGCPAVVDKVATVEDLVVNKIKDGAENYCSLDEASRTEVRKRVDKKMSPFIFRVYCSEDKVPSCLKEESE